MGLFCIYLGNNALNIQLHYMKDNICINWPCSHETPQEKLRVKDHLITILSLTSKLLLTNELEYNLVLEVQLNKSGYKVRYCNV